MLLLRKKKINQKSNLKLMQVIIFISLKRRKYKADCSCYLNEYGPYIDRFYPE